MSKYNTMRCMLFYFRYDTSNLRARVFAHPFIFCSWITWSGYIWLYNTLMIVQLSSNSNSTICKFRWIYQWNTTPGRTEIQVKFQASKLNFDSFTSQRCSIYTENVIIIIIIIIPANSHTFQILTKKKTTFDAMSTEQHGRPENNGYNHNKSTNNKSDWVYFE